MSDLSFETTAFTDAAAKYVELADKMEALKNDLAGDISQLVENEWVGEASREFMKQYQDTWAENVMEYVTFLRYLNELILGAGQEYTALAEYVEGVAFPG